MTTAESAKHNWRPISTAPKDDSRFLVGRFSEVGEFEFELSHNENPKGPHEKRGWNHRNGPFGGRATHWAPPPISPDKPEPEPEEPEDESL